MKPVGACVVHGATACRWCDPWPEPTRCPMCGDNGWILDANDRGKPGPRMLEFLPCLLPDCAHSGRPVRSVNFEASAFTHASTNPLTGYVMSVTE